MHFELYLSKTHTVHLTVTNQHLNTKKKHMQNARIKYLFFFREGGGQTTSGNICDKCKERLSSITLDTHSRCPLS